MANWIRQGIEGRNVVSILKLYLLGILFSAPWILLLTFLLDAPTAFKFTPVFIIIWAIVAYVSAYLTTTQYVASEFWAIPNPWLQLIPEYSTSTLIINPSAIDAIELTRRGAEIADRFGRWSEAADLYDRALSIDPFMPETWSNKAIALWQLGDRARALACINQALAINPGIAEIWFNKALASWKLGSKEKAIAFFKRALKIKPQFSIALLNNEPDYTSAFTIYEQRLISEVSSAEMWLLKGQLLCSIQRYREALECFDIASSFGSSQAAKEKIRISALLNMT